MLQFKHIRNTNGKLQNDRNPLKKPLWGIWKHIWHTGPFFFKTGHYFLCFEKGPSTICSICLLLLWCKSLFYPETSAGNVEWVPLKWLKRGKLALIKKYFWKFQKFVFLLRGEFPAFYLCISQRNNHLIRGCKEQPHYLCWCACLYAVVFAFLLRYLPTRVMC